MTPSLLARALTLSAALAFTPLALAQTTGATTAAPSPSPTRALPPGFEPVPGGAQRAESVDANKLVVAAYGGFLVAFFGYMVWVVRRQAALSREVEELAARLEKRR